MINYEEELKKFHSSLDVNEAEDAIYNRDLTDIMKPDGYHRYSQRADER